jgi:hypothetical protein
MKVVLSFTPRPLYLRGKRQRYPWIGGEVDPRAGLDVAANRNILLPLPGIEL